jgi:hypothetical protein
MIKRIFVFFVVSALVLFSFGTVALAAECDLEPCATEKPELDTDPTEGGNAGGTSDGVSDENNGSANNGGSVDNGSENSARDGINPITVVIFIAVPVAVAAAAWLIYISVNKKK